MSEPVNEKLKQASVFKRRAYFAMEDLRHAGLVARIFGAFIIFLIVANAVLVFAETRSDIPENVADLFLIFGLVSSVCFGLEYAARLWVADLAHPLLAPARARLRYACSAMGIIDLLAFLPGLLVLLIPVPPSAIEAVRIVRLVRLIKLSRYMRGLQSITRVLTKRRREIVAAVMVLALLTVTASVLMYEIENPVQPEQFDSVFTGMYWAMTTITSTGYGDLVPITPLGRFVGFMTMLLSIGVVAIPAGIFSAGFVEEYRAEAEENSLRRMRSEAEEKHLPEVDQKDEVTLK